MRAARIAMITCLALMLAAPVDALTLDALMHDLAGVASRQASFVETKEMALLNGPLVRRGTLEYTRPDRLSMRVDSPYYERVEIAGDQVTIERRSGVTKVSLAAQPQLGAWIDSLRATLAGDAATLQRHFDVRVEGSAADWTLALVPRDPALRAVIERVDIAGRAAEVTRFAIDETKGDRTRIVIAPRGAR
jgi:outer membrane lipoprotein-sorting protein